MHIAHPSVINHHDLDAASLPRSLELASHTKYLQYLLYQSKYCTVPYHTVLVSGIMPCASHAAFTSESLNS